NGVSMPWEPPGIAQVSNRHRHVVDFNRTELDDKKFCPLYWKVLVETEHSSRPVRERKPPGYSSVHDAMASTSVQDEFQLMKVTDSPFEDDQKSLPQLEGHLVADIGTRAIGIL